MVGALRLRTLQRSQRLLLSTDTSRQSVELFHRDVDARADEIAARNQGRLQCGRGCSGCCVDDITVFQVEADQIRSNDRYTELLAHGTPHAEGACAFLDPGGACRVYDARPYVCRTQGLPLRWIDEEQEAEMRDICALNDEAVDGAKYPTIVELPEADCWTIGEPEARLRQLQTEYQHQRRSGPHEPASSAAAAHDMPLERVRLRDLFAASS
jgi:Fe-S-cluster containining protein